MASTLDSVHTPLLKLASQLEQDMKRRGLGSGDPYLSAAEAGSLLGVSRATANRALNLMAEQQKLLRQQGRGTFVGPAFEPERGQQFRHLLLLVPQDVMPYAAFSLPAIQAAAAEVFPDEVFQIVTLPASRDQTYLETILSDEQRSAYTAVVLISGTADHYRFLQERAIPTLAFGSPPPGIDALISCDKDASAGGRQLGQYVTQRGHKRIMVMLGSSGRQGTHELYEGVTHALTEAGLPPSALSVVLAPPTYAETREALREAIARQRPPVAVLVNGLAMARLAAEVVADLGLSMPDDVEIVYEQGGLSADHDGRFTHVRPRLDARDIAHAGFHLLSQRCAGEPVERPRVRLDVELTKGSLVSVDAAADPTAWK